MRFNAKAGTVYYIALATKGPGGETVLSWAYSSSGAFRFATEGLLTAGNLIVPYYQASSLESIGAADPTTFQTYYTYDVPGVLVSVTRIGGGAGRALVDYTTSDLVAPARFNECVGGRRGPITLQSRGLWCSMTSK